MNDKIQEKIDAQLPKGNTGGKPPEQNIPNKPLSIDAILERDRRRTDIVEINIANQFAIVVESSDAPELTAEVIAEKGKPTMTVDLDFEGQPLTIEVINGVSFAVEVERSKRLRDFEGRDLTPKEAYDRNLSILQLLVSRLLVSPKFSFQGEGDGVPIEKQSEFLLESFYKVVAEVTAPATLTGTYQELHATLESWSEKLTTFENDLAEKRKASEDATGEPLEKLRTAIGDLEREKLIAKNTVDIAETGLSHIYQVQVHRGTPLESALLSDSFEFYPTGEGKSIKEMTDDVLDAHVQRIDAQRAAFVASMILSPALSWNGEGKAEAYPVEHIGEHMMQTLYNAHKAVNVKTGGLDLLKRFRKVGTV